MNFNIQQPKANLRECNHVKRKINWWVICAWVFVVLVWSGMIASCVRNW